MSVLGNVEGLALDGVAISQRVSVPLGWIPCFLRRPCSLQHAHVPLSQLNDRLQVADAAHHQGPSLDY